MARAPPPLLPILPLLLAVIQTRALNFASVATAVAAGRALVQSLNPSDGSTDVVTVPTVAPPPPSPPPPAQRRNHGPRRRHHTREFLDSHNTVRKYVGVEPFVWNSTITRMARRYLNKKRDTCEMVHSDMKDLGENLFWGGGTRWRPSDAVQAWAQEHFYYDPEKNDCLPGRICGHYTQIIWRRSLQLGCARIECTNGGVLISCNYMPSGNYLGETPFQTDP